MRRLSGWRWSGSSLLGLVEAAEQLGFVTVCARIGPELLPELPVPSIVHVEGDHFVVVRGTGPRHIELADPTGGCLRVPLEAFLSQWRGVALLLWPATSGVTLPASATRA